MAISSLSGTGNQPYTTARVDYLATYLQGQLPGLSHDAAVKWINAERGVHGNVLGVTYRDASGQHLYTYSSQEAGIRAAASLVNRSGNYAGIRASLGGSTIEQLRAIAASPWNAPNHYSAWGFGVPPSVGSQPIVPIPATLVSAEADTERMRAALIAAGISTDPTHALTLPEARALTRQLYPLWRGDSLFSTGITVGALLKLKTLGTQGGEAVGAVGDAIGFGISAAAFLFDVENWTYIAALVVGVPLALIGFYLLAGVQTGGQNA
jgi:hypothetical protein